MQDFLDPKKALKEIKVHEGHKVGDFGCGTGGFTKVLGPIVGTTGRVFAVDVQKSICDRLEKEVKEGVGILKDDLHSIKELLVKPNNLVPQLSMQTPERK